MNYGLLYPDSDSEEGVVVENGVVGAESAEHVGELTNGLAVGRTSS